MLRVLLTDPLSETGLALLRQHPEISFDQLAERGGIEKLPEIIGEYDAAITRSGGRFDAATLALAGRMRVIGRAGVGLDNIDVEAASRHGILVVNTPSANTVSAAEHTLALMLSLARHIPQAHASTREGGWERKRFVGSELYEKTLGIVGFGRIGSAVAARARAFRMRVMAFDPYMAAAAMEDQGVRGATLEEVLAEADFLTIHMPLTPETRHMIGATELALMKRTARLVNCARGGVVDEEALAAALAGGKLAGAAVDVFEEEPPKNSPLLALPNVVLTPHLGASTQEAQERVAVQTVEMVLAALGGSLFVGAVNLPFGGASDEAHRLTPFLDLGERLGSFAAQLKPGAVEGVDIEVWGIAEESVKLLRLAVLKGLLCEQLGGGINYVNAVHTAQQRGIKVTERVHLEGHDYQNLLAVTVRGRRTRRIAGTVFSDAHARITEIDGFRMEVQPHGMLFYIVNRDVPGVVGKVGTVLGEHGINIAEYNLGRVAGGGRATAVVAVDSEVGERTLAALSALPEIEEVRLVRLGPCPPPRGAEEP